MPRYVDIEPYDGCRIVLNTEDGGIPCKSLATADVQEVKKASLKRKIKKYKLACAECSGCHMMTPVNFYCCHCGARFDDFSSEYEKLTQEAFGKIMKLIQEIKNG